MFISPTVVGNNVIVGSCAGSVFALDRTSGTPAWLYDTRTDGQRAQFHGEPLVIGDRVVIPTDADPKGHLYAFDIASGAPLWKIAFDHGVATTPLIVGDRVVSMSAEGDVTAVDPKDGSVKWRAAPAGQLKPIPFIASPAAGSKHIFVADNKDAVYAIDRTNGSTLWKRTLAARPSTALLVSGNSVIAGTADGFINWIAADSGKVKRRVHLADGQPFGTAILSRPLLFVVAAGAKGYLLALDADTGAVRWKQETPKEWTTYRPLVTGSVVIAGDTEKNVCAFDQKTGNRLWCRSVGQVPRGLGVSNDGVLYVGSLSGVVQAFRLSDAARR